MKTLQKIWTDLSAAGYKTDKGDVHSYLPIYEDILAPYRETALNVLEIGLFNGHSMRMWEEYYIKAVVHGIDCDLQPHGGLADLKPMMEEGGHCIYIMNAEDSEMVKNIFKDVKFDVIIDDAGHHIEQQLNLFKIFKEYLSDGGIYIIEDIQDLDEDIHLFRTIDDEMAAEIIDRRHIKNRYDDVMVVIRKSL